MRMGILNGDIPKDFKSIFNIARDAQTEGINVAKSGIPVGNIAKAIAGKMGGGGGGSPAVAQAGGKNADQLAEALGSTEEIIRESLNDGAGS